MYDIMISNIERFDIPLLQAFRALVEESGVTRAAHRLGISQPTMSGHLKQLRALFHDPLLTRAAGGSRPTERARVLLVAVNDVLRRVEALAAASTAQASPRDYDLTVKVAATDYFQQTLLSRIYGQVRAQAPGIRFDFHMADRTTVRERMERGIVDLGLGPRNVPSGSLHFRRLYRDPGRCIASPGLFGPGPLTLERYCALPHVRVMPARESYFDSSVRTRLDALGRTRDIVMTVRDFLILPTIVQSAPVVATVPSMLLRTVPQDDRLDVRPLPLSIRDMDVGLYWHARTHNDPVHQWLRALTLQAFSDFVP